MLVGLEATPACRPRHTGVARYARRLMAALAQLSGVESDFTLQAYVRLSRRFKRGYSPPRIEGIPLRYTLDRRRPRGLSPDLVHGLELRVPTWVRSHSIPHLVTVHDLFGVIGSEYLDPHHCERNRLRYQDAADHATRIVTVSACTRRDFLEHYEFDPQRVHVTHLGVDDRFRPALPEDVRHVRARHGIERPFLLYVGDVTPRKNLRRLIEAFGTCRAAREHDLVLAGSIEDGLAEIAEELRRCPARQRIRLLGFVDESDLLVLYSAAAALLYPTLYEGFGLPLLEALASGTPALGANVGAAPEVAAGHAVLVDPKDVGAIAEGIDRVLETDAEALERARAHALTFTWERCARQTVEVYRLCLQEAPS